MKTKHTPGPWEAVIYDGPFDQPLIKSGHGTIGRLHGMEDRQHEANAKLVAAAPELLEALQDLLKGVNGLPPLTAIAGVLTQQCKHAEAAIKKATE